MTANEMKYEFLIAFDSISNFTAPDYEDVEISNILTKAQERFVLRYYGGNNKIKQSFELTEKGRKDLSELIRFAAITAPSTDQVGVFPNGVYFDLPADFMFAIQEELVADSIDDCIDDTIIKIKPMTHDNYNSNIKNPFKNPDESLAWRLDYHTGVAKRHQIITGSTYTVNTYNMRYLKYPVAIVVDSATPANQVNSELNEITHRRIIDEAVSLALEYTKDGRLQTQLLMNQVNE